MPTAAEIAREAYEEWEVKQRELAEQRDAEERRRQLERVRQLQKQAERVFKDSPIHHWFPGVEWQLSERWTDRLSCRYIFWSGAADDLVRLMVDPQFPGRVWFITDHDPELRWRYVPVESALDVGMKLYEQEHPPVEAAAVLD